MIAERVVEFGPGRRWVGVLSQASAELLSGQRVALLLTNAGIIHRAGPNRLHVRLARTFAAAGIPAFRYDLPGIGDSEPAAGDLDEARGNVVATMAAMSALEHAGVAERFVLFGICTGANHAFHTALADPRVLAAVMVDPTAVFSTSRHRMLSIVAKLRRGLRPRTIGRLVGGGVATVSAAMRDEPNPGAPVLLHRERHIAEWTQANAAFTTLADRGTQLLFVMTLHNSSVYTYEEQMRDAFPQIEGLERILTCVCFRDSKHTFSRERHRELLEKKMLEWFDSLNSPASSSSARNPSE